MDDDPEFILRLAGPLRLQRAGDGRDLTPRSLKAQGLLALIATAPAYRRSRAYLQDKLWSDSPPAHGAASLRQTMHRLRETAGPEMSWLTSNPGWIGLDVTRVRVQVDPDAQDWEASGDPPEFCEGLDIPDAEFEDWIRDQRLAFEDRIAAGPPAPPPPRLPVLPVRTAQPRPEAGATLFVAAAVLDDPEVAALARVIGTQIAMAVGRMGGARVQIAEHPEVAAPPDALRLEIQGCRLGGKFMLQAGLSEDGALVWSNGRAFPSGAIGDAGDTAYGGFVSEVTAAATHHLGRGGTGEGAPRVRAGYRAIEELFTLDRESLARCERIFAATTEGPAAAIHRAWRAQIRVISVIERLATDPGRAAFEALDLMAQALRDEPHNSIVNTIAADVALLFENSPLKAAHHARLAVERDPFNPYARASAAQTLAFLGKPVEAHVEAGHALRLARSLPNQSWWLMRCCITAVRCGRYEEATRYAQTAHELAPGFKPPLRFLAALRFHAREEAKAAEALVRLKAIEPDFSLSLMRQSDYPTTSLQGTPLIAVTESRLL